ncbi:hypothetical protein GCM10027613_49200 [Microlunatus endophyticus]
MISEGTVVDDGLGEFNTWSLHGDSSRVCDRTHTHRVPGSQSERRSRSRSVLEAGLRSRSAGLSAAPVRSVFPKTTTEDRDYRIHRTLSPLKGKAWGQSFSNCSVFSCATADYPGQPG